MLVPAGKKPGKAARAVAMKGFGTKFAVSTRPSLIVKATAAFVPVALPLHESKSQPAAGCGGDRVGVADLALGCAGMKPAVTVLLPA